MSAVALRCFGKTFIPLRILSKGAPTSVLHIQVRNTQQRWRLWRAAKYIKGFEFNYDELRRDASKTYGEVRAEQMRRPREGPIVNPTRDVSLSCTSQIMNKYVPPEGDGKASFISTKKAKQTVTGTMEGARNLRNLRKIKKFDPDFKRSSFPALAQDIYIETHQLLESFSDNEDRLHELVTELAYPEMVWKLERMSLRWKFIQSVESPKVVHIEAIEQLSKDDYFGQITVRFHTKQTLALYDRFGRLMFGSENLVKNCLEYVVFEKHLSDEYGQWRIHGKIIPKWLESPGVLNRTYRRPKVSRADLKEEMKEQKEREENEKKGKPKKKDRNGSSKLKDTVIV